MPGDLKYGNGVLARDGWKLGKKLIERVAALEVVNEALYRRARPGKDGRAAEAIRRTRDERVWHR